METTLRHQKIPELRHRDIQRHRLPVRPSEPRRWVRQAELNKAERKAQREERKKAETAIAILGLSLLGKLLDAMKPNEPVQSPSKEPDKTIIPDRDITDAEFVDVIEEPETTALVIKS